MRIKMLSFLFLFACMRFVLFVLVKSFCKKKIERFKIVLIPSFTILLTCSPLNLPMKSYLYALIFIYDHHPWGVFSIYGNLFCLWESLLIYDHHLWWSFLFMRISSYLWLSVRIFSVYENLFLFMLLIYDHLRGSLLIYDQLFHYLFFITLTHLCVLILIFFCHSFTLISMNWKSSWT